MSEQDFELYLKLLSRCLALTSRQREQIADELRDHLEERLDELARAGLPREKAVVQRSTNSATPPFWPLTSPRLPV